MQHWETDRQQLWETESKAFPIVFSHSRKERWKENQNHPAVLVKQFQTREKDKLFTFPKCWFSFVVDSDMTLHGVHTVTVAVSPTDLINCSFCSYLSTITDAHSARTGLRERSILIVHEGPRLWYVQQCLGCRWLQWYRMAAPRQRQPQYYWRSIYKQYLAYDTGRHIPVCTWIHSGRLGRRLWVSQTAWLSAILESE